MRLPRELAVVVVAAVAISDCLDPTEIELVLSTDVPCANVRNVAISVGAAIDDKRAVNTVTPNCSDDGGIGTLFIVPSHGTDDVVGIRATLGIAADSDKCIEPNFTGCIVARRSLHYIAHRRLTLPIELDQACLDNACTPSSTCLHGQCVDAGVTCTNDDCNVPGDGGPITMDAGSCNIGPVLVNPMGTKVQPHIVKLSTGYAVGFDAAVTTNPRPYLVAAVSATGVATPGVLVATVPQGSASGPLGTDGSNYAFAHQSGAGNVTVHVVAPDGTAVVPSVQGGLLFSVGLTGLFSTSFPGELVFLTTDNTGQPELANVESSGSYSYGSVDANIQFVQNMTLAKFGSSYLATFTSGTTCYLSTCAFPASCSNAQTFTTCTTARAALQSIGTLVATRHDNGGTFSGNLFFQTSPATIVSFGDVEDEGIVLLATGSAFKLVWASGGVVQAEGVAAGLSQTAPDTLATVTSPALFDAVADGTGTGYAVTYYDDRATVPGVYFAHRCN